MRVIGLTGGIASGKSTVARIFAELGATVLSADEISREVMAPGSPTLAAVKHAFPSAFRPDGTLDRAALGEQVFADLAARRLLNAITHPPIRARIVQLLSGWRRLPPDERPRVVILEHPLLFEANHTDLIEGIILVVAQQTTQVARLTNVMRLTEEQAWRRVRSQGPAEEKIPLADWVIDGESSLPDVRRQVEQIWHGLVPPTSA
jgi:dephospho-CoA kinase